MPAGRIIRLSVPPGQILHPVYLVAAPELGAAVDVLKTARVVNGSTPEDIGPISERVIDRLRLRPGQFIQMKDGKLIKGR
jgi:hypothetical protein